MKPTLLALLVSILWLQACHNKKSSTGGLSPQEALSGFQLADNFKIELVASEPLISDPVAMEIDENGDFFVVEMHGYPLDKKGSGVVKLLKDTNGDGQPDKSLVFADNLGLPTGIMKWKKGLLVVDVPNVLYLEDTDNDGKADKREVMITGLAVTNPQHIANTPIYALDNWIYVAHQTAVTPKVAMEFSDTGSKVRFVNFPGAQQLPGDADGRNIRFKPETGELEMLAGESQYGHTFDPWGHHFGTSNADHLFHEVVDAKYLLRNPNLQISDVTEHIPDHGNASEVFPVTENPKHQLLTDVGVITSSCGVTWYQGGLFPDSFNNVTFIAEPVHNLVHADRVIARGATFSAARLYQKKEFLASTDSWFRPVQFYIGPDGALYLIDYYREIIEHPEWMSDSVNKSGALYNGSDKGRIYRITPANTGKMNWCNNINLGRASTTNLVTQLANKNIWWRRNAQRLLLDKKAPETVSMLKTLLDTTISATATVHALWTLAGSNAINESSLEKALHHGVAGVRENAIRIAEAHLGKSAKVETDLLSLNNDPDAQVRYQLLGTLGNSNDKKAERVRQQLLMKDIEDKWVQFAALSSSPGKEFGLMERVATAGEPTIGKQLFVKNCASVIGLSGRVDEIKKIVRLAAVKNSVGWWQSSALEGLAKALKNKKPAAENFSAERKMLLSTFTATTDPATRAASIDLLAVLGVEKNATWNDVVLKARTVINDKQARLSFRTDALRLLAMEKNSDDLANVRQLVTPGEPEAIQQSALQAYNKIAAKDAADFIVNRWKSLTPIVREAGIAVLLSSNENRKILLQALEKNSIQSSSISWPRRVQLMSNNDEDIRKRSRGLFSDQLEKRDQVFKNYQGALSMKGDARQGRLIFKNVCGGCHQVAGQDGKNFGPDLASIRNRNPEFIMADILHPNRSIADKYEMWDISKANGEKINGIISSETPATITLRQLGGQENILTRAEIRSMEALTQSAMPSGLEKSVSVKEMADLIAFLKNTH